MVVPSNFKLEELFSGRLLESLGRSDSVWRLMDSRVLITLDRIRERFGIVFVNDYLWGGHNHLRGFRHPFEILDWKKYKENGFLKARFSSFTSQHCFGRAADCSCHNYTAEEIRQDMRHNPNIPCYEYITAVEDRVNWFHFDVRNFGPGVLWFTS